LGLSLRSIAAAKKRMILTHVEIGLLAIAVGVFLSFLLTRSITRPINSLVNGTKSIAKGELGPQISITTKDELGELASSFNAMSADLKQGKEEEERRIKQLIALNQASQTVNVSLELDQVLAKIVSLASETVDADYTSVMLLDEANHMHRGTENLPGVPSTEYRIRDEGLTSWIMRSGQAVIIDEIGEDGAINPDLDEGAPRFANPHMVKVGVKSVAGLPLKGRDRLLGVVHFHSLGTFHGQLSLLVTFANQVAIAVENARLYEKVQQELTERKQAEEALRLSFIQLAETVSRAMESQDPYTAGHQRQVAELARAVGEKLGLNQERLQGLYIGGLLHDIGKISIPAEILTHPGKLSDVERTLIRTHPRRGYEILEQVEFPWPVADIALHHHERLNGTGYPDGLKGDQLSLEVRILAVCDVVDAMSSDRPYRSGRPMSEVTAELRAGKGTKYDPKVVDILIGIIESRELLWDDNSHRRGAEDAEGSG
jgi:putative nucleotidyltransferase with HDIG domain